MAVDYLALLRDLVQERQEWLSRRDEAERQLSRLSELIRSTIKMLTPEQRAHIDCDVLLERLDHRPPGLTNFIRTAFTAAGKEWLTPVEIRDYLKRVGFNFERYKANPLASIHTTLRRMVPHEAERQTIDGQTAYRLKTIEQWRSSMAEIKQWVKDFRNERPNFAAAKAEKAPAGQSFPASVEKTDARKKRTSDDQNTRPAKTGKRSGQI